MEAVCGFVSCLETGPGVTMLGAHTGFSTFTCRSGSPALCAGIKPRAQQAAQHSTALIDSCDANAIGNVRDKHTTTTPQCLFLDHMQFHLPISGYSP